MTTPTFEFTADQNTQFHTASKWMRFAAWIQIIAAVLSVIGWAKTRDGGLLGGVIFGLVGYWTLGAAKAFRQVAETTGGDVSHVMRAVEQLKRLYKFQGLLFLVMFVLIVILAVMAGGGGA